MAELHSIQVDWGDGEKFEATPENTSLFRFIGDLAMYNHVFFQTDDEHGVYVFPIHPLFGQISEVMVVNGYPLHDNLRQVADVDIYAYDKMIERNTADVGDFIPKEWEK